MTSPEFSTLVELLRYRATHQPDQTAYTFLQDGEVESGSLNYRELNQQAQSIAAYLRQSTYPGDRALLLYPSGLDFIAAFMGCLYAGVVAVPAYPPRRNQKRSRLETIVNDAQPSVVLTTSLILAILQQQWTEHPQLIHLPCVATDQMTAVKTKCVNWSQIYADSLAFLQYTSGSTGRPKGVMVSHRNILHNLAQIQAGFGHIPQSQGVIWLPLYHDMGLIGGVLQPLFVGCSVVLMSPTAFLQKPIRWLQAISRYRATTSGGPNSAYELCVNRISPKQMTTLDLSCWQVAFNGAEPIRAESLQRFSDTFSECGFRSEAFYPCYGMAETTLIVSGGSPSKAPTLKHIQTSALEQHQAVFLDQPQQDGRTIVGCGQAALEQTIVIANLSTQMQCLPGQVGEIWVSGKNVTRGYWNQPKVTEETFNAYLADSNQGPFLRTGDLGFVLEGELYVTGRIKDVIIIHGQNHYPQDIEQTVQKSHPSLRPSRGAAFMVEIDSQERLIIVQEVERTHLRKLEVSEVVRQLRTAVAAYHGLQVSAAVLVKPGSIPLTSSGKIQRYVCRTKYLNGKLQALSDVHALQL